MDKNVRKNPFGHVDTAQQSLPSKVDLIKYSLPKVETTKTSLPPKVETTKTTLPPKFKQEEEKKVEPIPEPINNQPEINTEYEALKQYNSPKSYIRLTTERLPANPNLLKESSLPFSLIINPLNSFESEVYTI
jgi:hypothetical protein